MTFLKLFPNDMKKALLLLPQISLLSSGVIFLLTMYLRQLYLTGLFITLWFLRLMAPVIGLKTSKKGVVIDRDVAFWHYGKKSGFCYGIYLNFEVTQGQWAKVTGTRPWRGAFPFKVGLEYPTFKVGLEYPATWVGRDDAVAFCSKLSEKEGRDYRLPTEAEWEYSCRAGSNTAYSFGNSDDDLSDYAWWGGWIGRGIELWN